MPQLGPRAGGAPQGHQHVPHRAIWGQTAGGDGRWVSRRHRRASHARRQRLPPPLAHPRPAPLPRTLQVAATKKDFKDARSEINQKGLIGFFATKPTASAKKTLVYYSRMFIWTAYQKYGWKGAITGAWVGGRARGWWGVVTLRRARLGRPLHAHSRPHHHHPRAAILLLKMAFVYVMAFLWPIAVASTAAWFAWTEVIQPRLAQRGGKPKPAGKTS